MPRSSATQRLSNEKRVKFSVSLTEENNDLIRDYRFSLIMQTHNTEITLVDIIDEVFINFREYLNDPRKINIRKTAKKSRECRTVLTFRPEDKELMRNYQFKHIMLTKDTSFTLTDVINEMIDIFRVQLQLKGFEVMPRPEIVRAAESTKTTQQKNDR